MPGVSMERLAAIVNLLSTWTHGMGQSGDELHR